MTELPYIFEMNPDDWFEAVQEIAEELTETIADALGEYDSPQEVFEAIEPELEPYIIDADDPTQHQLLAEVEGDVFYIGQPEEAWYGLTYREEEGYWWLEEEEPTEDDIGVQELHRRLARMVVDAVSWGNEEMARERAKNQAAKRAIVEPYLEAVQGAGGPSARAIDLREPFRDFVTSCLSKTEEMDLIDRSPSDKHTHFVITRAGEEVGHVLAVNPGASREKEKLEKAFGIEVSAENDVLVVTDHLRFVWYPFLGTPRASNTLLLPKKRDKETVDYFYEIDWTVSQMIHSLHPE